MAAGTAVGELARGYFGNFIKVPFDGQNIGGMVAATQRLLEADAQVIAEASFSFGGNFCSVDILRRLDGGYEIVEVKSASGTTDDPPEKLAQTYLDDMAYQYYVAALCGLDIKKISLMRLNKAYTRQGALDLQQLFVLTDCTDIVQRMQAEVAENIAHIRAVALQAAAKR